MMQVLLFIFLSGFGSFASGEEQHVTVRGQIECRGISQPGIFVQMYDEDSIPVIDNDDFMGSTNSDYKGSFCVKGVTNEFTTIEPYIYIEHNCGYENSGEKGVYVQEIPIEYIRPSKPHGVDIFNIGTIELWIEGAINDKNYTKTHHHHHHYFLNRLNENSTFQEKVRFCMPHYVQYRRYYEHNTFDRVEESRVLPTDEPTVEPSTKEIVGTQQTEEQLIHRKEEIQTKVEEETRILIKDEKKLIEAEETVLELDKKELEEATRVANEEQRNQQKLLEEERLKQYREQMRIYEIEKKKAEEERRQIEEERKRTEELRRLAEEERKKSEEIRRLEEEERRRQEELSRQQSIPAVVKKDPCQIYPVVRDDRITEYVEDPCDRRIR